MRERHAFVHDAHAFHELVGKRLERVVIGHIKRKRVLLYDEALRAVSAEEHQPLDLFHDGVLRLRLTSDLRHQREGHGDPFLEIGIACLPHTILDVGGVGAQPQDRIVPNLGNGEVHRRVLHSLTHGILQLTVGLTLYTLVDSL